MEENKNLALYNRVREVPQEAKRDIQAGRLKGKTDINPLWRIQTLTREFGPAGIGWYTEIVRQWNEESGNERAVYLKLNLYVKVNGEWSKPIEGFGGAMVVASEKNGLFLDDDAAKKAYTDAISQACRSLGIGADVYWANDATKYQQEKAFNESREQAIEYLQNLKTPQQLQEAWAYYQQYFGKDKDFIKAYNKRMKEITDAANGNKR
ncbi:MAG: hypothetical protein IK114_14085 [Fibrobacter sp.]|nr:hypothetical protein [Fibrobacter sp.]